MDIFRICSLAYVTLLVASPFAATQETISVDVTAPIAVCSAKQMTADPCAAPPRLVRKTDPVYPEQDRKAKIDGTVVLNVIVGSDGKVRDIHVARSLKPELDEAAITAIRQWEFQPGTYLGKPVATKVNVEMNFRLTRDASSQAASPASAVTGPEQLQNLSAAAGDAYSRHDFATAAKLSRQLTELVPQSRNAWNQLGMSLLELKQFDAAADALKKQIEIDPGSPFAYNNLGRVYGQQHKYDLSIEQFKKQLVINPQDRYAHANLGSALYQQKKYADAAAELAKAMEITPANSGVLLVLAECDLELGNQQKAVDEFSRAAGAASSPAVWNNAAYQLATHNVQLDRAQKWAESAVEIESAGLRDVSLGHLTLVQMDRARALAVYWDTLGWVHFVRGDAQGAEPYIRASWTSHPTAVVGDHLGQVYEKLGHRDEALYSYAAALVCSRTSDESAEQEAGPELMQRMLRIGGVKFNPDSTVEIGKKELAPLQSVSVPNPDKLSGSGDFVLLVAKPNKVVDVRQITGDATLKPLTVALRSAKSPLDLPPSAEVLMPRRGTMTCTAGQSVCQLVLLSTNQASDVARMEAGSETASSVTESLGKPTLYNNPAMGMTFTLPEGWKLVSEQAPSPAQPARATFQKPNSLAAIIVVCQHLEATSDLYRKIVEEFAAKKADYARTSDAPVVRDGIQGERWDIRWKEPNGIAYEALIEFFTAQDEHYQVVAEAPIEVFSRYAQSFEQALQSTHFPMLHVSARDVLPQIK
jgi:TonB family protein